MSKKFTLPGLPRRRTRSAEERFLEKVSVDENGCWVWTAKRNQQGYGDFWFLGRTWRAHKWAYEMYVGGTEGLCVLHACDNTSCVNPDHLFLGTHQDNMIDRNEKQRQVRGETHPQAKLSEEQINEIRSRYTGAWGEQRMLAREYGVTSQTIHHVVMGKGWTHV